MRIIRLFKEIRNYFIFKKIIKKEKRTSAKWNKYKLRNDWIYRIYTVVNLPAEVTRSPDIPKESRIGFVLEEIKKINDYLGIDLNLGEIISLGAKPIKNTDEESYLVYWFFIFRELTVLYLIRLILFLFAIIYIIINKNEIYNFIFELTKKLFNF